MCKVSQRRLPIIPGSFGPLSVGHRCLASPGCITAEDSSVPDSPLEGQTRLIWLRLQVETHSRHTHTHTHTHTQTHTHTHTHTHTETDTDTHTHTCSQTHKGISLLSISAEG